ncbi:hypothetical protein [Mesorhizobium carmichaelinearum]|uniref:hypothetical protein n=1 Tax=Mesorhizobium carmichaelinearum TaxID=1208188 RepID=UPI000BA4C9B5|nr:hypothetical protein [Mesorhizobium carmichaelinearum]
MSMFKWSEVALEVAGAKLVIKKQEQKISELQTNLSNAQTDLAQVEEKAPDTAVLASTIQDAQQKAGYTVDQKTIKFIATESLKPLQTYLNSPEWNMTTNHPLYVPDNKKSAPAMAPAPEKLPQVLSR